MSLRCSTRIERNSKCIERAQHEAKLRARATALDANYPFAIDANPFGQRRLIETKFLAAVSNDGPQIGGCANEHVQFHMLPNVDIIHMLPIEDNS